MTLNLDSWIERVQSAKSRDEIIGLLVVALEIVRDEFEAERSDGGPPLLDEAPTPEPVDTEFDVDSRPISHSVVELNGWYGWPIHCPFCGFETGADRMNEGQVCRHLLYVVSLGSFQYLSERLASAVGVDLVDGSWSLADSSIERKLGGMQRFLAAADTFPNHVRFVDYSAIDVAEIGFASEHEELYIWGREPKDPRR